MDLAADLWDRTRKLRWRVDRWAVRRLARRLAGRIPATEDADARAAMLGLLRVYEVTEAVYTDLIGVGEAAR